jgi:hypothetical protein
VVAELVRWIWLSWGVKSTGLTAGNMHDRCGVGAFPLHAGLRDAWIRTRQGSTIGRQLLNPIQQRRAMAFFDSEIVQGEAKRLFGDYQQLMQLGGEYGKFDREGKKLFIVRMEELMDRYRVFMKRFELSDDFQAKLTVEQLRTQLGQFGMTPEQMFEQMHHTLERMKGELEKDL